MNHENEAGFALRSSGDEGSHPVLSGVEATGRLDGVLFSMTLRQTYRNLGERTLEVVYTFPLPHRAVLLGFASELNGQRMLGTIVAKAEAERRYEKALAEGDAPVMVEALPGGLHTANIGNLKPGEEIVLEVRFAHWLAFEQGRLRVVIPTTVAPRFGSPERAGLQPQQVPEASIDAEYPLALAVTVAGTLSDATIECPTHRFTRESVEGGQLLRLGADAWLDRDVILLVQPREPRPSLVIQARDAVPGSAPNVVMAAFQVPASAPRERLALKILIDCSGSMGGDSIDSARIALRRVLACLGAQDHVSLSRFGSSVEHLQAPTACTTLAVRHLARMVDGIDADLGGTEMEAALKSVFALRSADGAGGGDAGTDVLLVTDGEIWQADETIREARSSGHRVFAIGVGTSPAEHVLRSLAEATGGACEFATPGENLETAASRMLGRIRQHPWRNARIEWGSEPVWHTELPAGVFGGDTLFAMAGLQAGVDATTIRLVATDHTGQQLEVARGEADAPMDGDTLPRTAAARRMASAGAAEALTVGLAYQLMGPQTNCILVHVRSAADRATDEAELHRVSSMLAAGWGGTSTAMPLLSLKKASMNTPTVWRSVRSAAAAAACFDSIELDGDAVAGLDTQRFSIVRDIDAEPASLRSLALAVVEHLAHGGQVHGLPAHCESLVLHAEVRRALDEAAAEGLGEGEAWLLLAHWINQRSSGIGSSMVASAVKLHVAGLDVLQVQACMALFDRLLGGYRVESWVQSRTQRLRKSMSRLVSAADM